MNFETVLLGLLIVSTLTGLATEAIKALLTEAGKTYKANLLAGCVALVLSVAVGSGYVILSGAGWNEQTIISIICLVLLSWLCAMLGYDKVMQAISQLKSNN